MGMAASQARLLSITARMSDNEANGQALSYTKQRLADQTEQINKEYNEALAATKLQVLTGFNGSIANYEDISYGLMTGFNKVACGKQYIVTDLKGRILVTQEQANAFKVGNGDFNVFLAELGYSQADLEKDQRVENENWVTNINNLNENDQIHLLDENGDNLLDENNNPVLKAIKDLTSEDKFNENVHEYYAAQFDNNGEFIGNDATATEVTPQSQGSYDNNKTTLDAKQQIHEAWDKYLKSVGKTFYDEEHEYRNDEIVFGYQQLDNMNSFGTNAQNTIDDDEQTFLNGFVTYMFPDDAGNYPKPINYEGTTAEQRELFDYALAITSQYYCNGDYVPHKMTTVNGAEQAVPETDSNGNVKRNSEIKHAVDLESGYLNYLKNIFNKMKTCGFYTEESESDTINNVTRYKNGTKSVSWFEEQLTQGKLTLQYYSATEKRFVSTTVSEDESIQEVEDERAIAQAESKYNQDLTALEKKDQMIDLELKKLDTEHNALQTEYDQVKKVIDKNVEKSFNLFS